MTDTPDFEALGVALEHATDVLERDRAMLAERLKAADRKAHRSRVLGIIGIVVGLIGILGALKAYSAAHTAQDAVDLVNAQRSEARVATCHAYNDQVVVNVNALNDASLGGWEFLIDAAAPQDRARADEFLESLRERFDAVKVPERDCSDAGIDAYLSTTTTEAP